MFIRLLSFIIFITSTLLFQSKIQAQQRHSENIYTLSGKVDSLAAGAIITLSSYDPISQESKELDKATLSEKGTYNLSFLFQHADLFKVSFGKTQSVLVAIDKGQKEVILNVEGKKKGYVETKGSPDSEILLGYEAFRKESLSRLISPTYATMRAAKGDAEKEVAAVQAYGHASELHRKELIDYALKNIGTSIALYGSVLRWTGDEEIGNLEKLVSDFKAVHPDLPMTKVMEEKLNRFKQVAIGVIAPSIELPDTSGVMKTMDNLKGKYTLVDFWASWCGPCLLQVPDLKKAYGNYQDKGFEIIGVSVDAREKRWKTAIKKYDMNWPHLSDLEGWKSTAARDYNVTFIPFNILIDEEGKIIAKNLHSAALQEKLKELFGE